MPIDQYDVISGLSKRYMHGGLYEFMFSWHTSDDSSAIARGNKEDIEED